MRYKILPLTLDEFKERYNVLCETIAFAYGRYLLTNINTHHYNDATIKEWYRNQFSSLLTSNTQY